MKNRFTMKKNLALLLALLLIVPSLFLLASCQGPAGLSAFELAVQNGFEGTEAEWLESIKGADGEDGKDGKDGKDGVSGGTLDSSGTATTDILNMRDINEAMLASVSIYCGFTEQASSGFGGLFGGGSGGETETFSAGSGVIYQLDRENGDAYIITNYHVVYNVDALENDHISDNIRVYLYGMLFSGTDTMEETGIEADYIGGSMTYDIAILKLSNSEKVKNSDAMAIKLANSDTVAAGMTAVAIGNPKGDGISITSGIVSVDSEHISMTAVDNLSTITLRVIRIDTAVNSGNSGGGLFNTAGELIGIVNAKTITSGVENIGYAIPSNVVANIAENILDHCDGVTNTLVKKCMVGITVTTTDTRAEYDEASGQITLYDTVEILEVSDSSIAKGVLKPGDVLIGITLDGTSQEIKRQHNLIDITLNARVGSTISLTVLRDGQEVVFTGTFSENEVSTVA